MVTGNLPIKLAGKIGGADRESKLGFECDLTQLKLDNLLPGYTKSAGKAAKASFTLVNDPEGPDLENFVFDALSHQLQLHAVT